MHLAACDIRVLRIYDCGTSPTVLKLASKVSWSQTLAMHCSVNHARLFVNHAVKSEMHSYHFHSDLFLRMYIFSCASSLSTTGASD